MTSKDKDTSSESRIEAVRRFNRFYTQKIGALNEGLLRSPFSLAEARVLYELAHREQVTATGLGSALSLDAGYLSRILRSFEKRKLITRKSSEKDKRQSFVSLTKLGAKTFRPLNDRSRGEVGEILKTLGPADQNRLIDAMNTVQGLLSGQREKQTASYILRTHQPGDMGWVIHRHGVLYSQEYGWDEHFEALVAEIAAHFIRNFDPKKERCWIAEIDGRIVGSVFLVKKSKTIAKLRMLYVEPETRGLGIGSRLVDECTRFAKQVGYRKIVLWTNNVLHAARKIYEKAGYQLVSQESQHSFGHDLVFENWELKL